MSTPPPPSYRDDWLSKTLAGVVLGFLIAVTASGLFLHLMPGNVADVGRFFVSRWIVVPVWVAVFSLVYLFRDGQRAWKTLGLLSLAMGAALLVSRHLSQ